MAGISCTKNQIFIILAVLRRSVLRVAGFSPPLAAWCLESTALEKHREPLATLCAI